MSKKNVKKWQKMAIFWQKLKKKNKKKNIFLKN